MANLASLEVYASSEDIVEVLGAGRSTTVISSGAIEVLFDNGVASIDNRVENGNVIVVADTNGNSNAFARKLFEELTSKTQWRVTLLDADSSEVVGERHAIRTSS